MKKKKKVTVSALLKTFDVGEKVILDSSHMTSGIFPRRYNGMHGKVLEKRGRSYIVGITDGGKTKKLITNAAHLKKAG